MYNCKYCNKEFKDKGNLRRHEKYSHEVSIEKVSCPFCNELFEKCGLATHIKSCKSNPDRYISKKEIKSFNEAWFSLPANCQYCGKECKNGNSCVNHERLCKENPNRKVLPINHEDNLKEYRAKIKSGEVTVWNKGLTKESDIRIAKACEKVAKYYETHEGSFKGKHHTEESKQKIKNFAIENESFRHFGFRKPFYYNNVKFQSSYEVEVAKSLDKNNIKWESPKRFPYLDHKGNKHYYIADLYLPEYDIYLDPKNDFLIENINPYFGYKDVDKIKWVMEQNNIKILILDKDHLDWINIKPLIHNIYGE